MAADGVDRLRTDAAPACHRVADDDAHFGFPVASIDRPQPDVTEVMLRLVLDREIRAVVALAYRGEPRLVLFLGNRTGAIHQAHQLGIVGPRPGLGEVLRAERREVHGGHGGQRCASGWKISTSTPRSFFITSRR